MDKFDFAIQVMVIGFTVVMVTLFLLYGILIIFSRIFNKQEKTDQTAEISSKSFSQVKVETDQTKLVAAITAAIASYFDTLESPFSIGRITVSEQPVSGSAANSWQITGRKQLMKGKTDLETIRRNKQREKI